MHFSSPPLRRALAVATVLAIASGIPAVAAPSVLKLKPENELKGLAARDSEPVVLTGSQLPSWSRLAAVGQAKLYPSGAFDGVRDAHNGVVVVPPDARTGVPTNEITAWSYDDGTFTEVRVQVDERFPYFLANGRSDFAPYSGTDEELTYAWDVESWKKTSGDCYATYPAGVTAMADPAAGLDDDDEIVVMASDAGERAPGSAHPAGVATGRQEVAIVDPTSGRTSYVYLYRRATGPAFDATSSYVSYQRDANADEWIDRDTFRADDPEKLGSSNTGYGPNLEGSVCDGTGLVTRMSTDRFPRDGVTVRTSAYEWRATGRWMVREMHVAKPGQPGVFGPDLIDRWKGRAFQQSPDSKISLVGFEDEQVNWEANSALLGERHGPVRAIRETWGADSGTNVTKTETFYRDVVAYRYRLRVHPIPPDGLYTSWDYNAGVASRYYTAMKPEGVAVDGQNDDIGNIDDLAGQPAFFDAPDPTLNVPSAFGTWEQVSGVGDTGSLVYTFENKSPTSLENPTVVPYYRDDKCLDDGTGDDPVARPWPGEASTDQRVKDGYAALAGKPYAELTCDDKQGAWASHGVHFFFTGDTDNAFITGKPTTEVDGQQWQFAVPTKAPKALGEPYANVIRARSQTVVTPQP